MKFVNKICLKVNLRLRIKKEFMENTENYSNIYPLNVELPSLKSLFIEMRFENKFLVLGLQSWLQKNKSSRCAVITNRHNAY